MSEIIPYGLVAIVILVLGYAIIRGLARAGRLGKAAPKPESRRGASHRSTMRSHEKAVQVANGLPDVRIRGAVRNGPKKRIGKIIDEHPDEAMSQIRHWLHGNGNENSG